MKKQFFNQKMLLLALMVTTALSSYAQQHFTQISNTNSSTGNTACNNCCTLIRTPQINSKTILMASPSGSSNTNGIAVWYIKVGPDSLWCIVDYPALPMPNGSKFEVDYYTNPDPNYQFIYRVNSTGTTQTIYNSYIDHVNLNGNPKANFRYIARGNGTNMWPVKVQYDAAVGKWYMFNDTNPHKAFDGQASYNIVIDPTNALGKSNIIVDTTHPKIIPVKKKPPRGRHN
jgi:hypothetical protein